MKIIHERRGRPSVYGRFTVLHATRGGGPVLRGQASWRTACGVLIQTQTHRWVASWRRCG